MKPNLKQFASVIFLLILPVILYSQQIPEKKEYPYKLTIIKDATLITTGLMTFGFGLWRLNKLSPHDQSKIKYNLPWDKSIRGQYSNSSALMSNILTVAFLGPIYLNFYHTEKNWTTTDIIITEFVMASEVLLLTTGINLFVRSLEVWPRPYLYNSRVSENDINEIGASGSFYSGHASATFAIATFLSVTYQTKYPGSKNIKWMWLSSYLIASSVSYCRVRAGKHYPTDIFAGAAVGILIGWLIPELHKKNNRFKTVIGYNSILFQFSI